MPGRYPRLTDRQRDRLLFLLSIGVPRAQLCLLFGVSPRILQDYIHGRHKKPLLRGEEVKP